MFETVREFALEQLQASGDEATTRQAHAAYYQDLAARLNIWKALSDQAGALAQLEVEHANLRAALAWLGEQGETGAIAFCRLCGDAFAFWWARGHLQESMDWLDRALRLPVPPAERAGSLQAMSYLRISRGELDLAEPLAREAVAVASAAKDHWVHAWALFVLGWHTDALGDVAGSVHFYEEALIVARNLAEPYPFLVGILNESLALAAFRLGDLDRAEMYAREAFAVLSPFDERYGFGYVLRLLGWICYRRGNTGEALAAWRRAFQTSREVDDPQQIAESLALFGRAALDADLAPLAARWLGAAETQRERSGRRMLEYHDLFEETIALARARLGPARFETDWRTGGGLAPDQVWTEIDDFALGQESQAAVSASPIPRLTPREQEILTLLAAGKTDREIAETLFIGVRTAEGHVARICEKLGVRTRTAAASTAHSAGLIAPVST